MHTEQLSSLSDSGFLNLLLQQDIELRLNEGRLRINAPTGAINNALKSEMVRRKDFLVEACRSARQINGTPILRDLSAPEDEAPLTYAQERLWLLERFHPGNSAYNIPQVFLLEPHFDETVLQQAIDYVASRHDSLRTRIVEHRDRVVQQVDPQARPMLEMIDLRNLPEADREASLKKLLREQARRPFTLHTAPLVRFHVYQLSDQRRLLLINLHHIVADRWATGILFRELTTAYKAIDAGLEPGLPPLPIQYTDYAIWERFAAKPGMQQQLEYWQKQFSQLPPMLELPFQRPPKPRQSPGTDFESTPGPSREGAICPLRLTPEETAGVRDLAKTSCASLYMVLLAAYATLLHRFTGATDLCIGSPVSERKYRETEPLIGLFVNTLVMRCRITAQASFLDILRGVRDTVLDAHANRDVPFQKILSSLHSSPDGTGHSSFAAPLFQTMLAFDSARQEPAAVEDHALELDPGFAKFDLTLQLQEDQERISGWFEYRTDLAAAASMERFAETFVGFLRSLLASPTTPVDSIELLTPGEKQLLLEWNKTELPFSSQHTIHRLFEEQAERTPSAIAVVDGDNRLSYRELNERANQVAHFLLGHGATLETVVGVRLERSAEMIAGLLGILKAGAAYLPLDPAYPEARLRVMLEDSGCRIVLSEAGAGAWPFSARPLDMALSRDEQRIGNPVTPVSASNLAYVIYTSGSTGRPKGVAIEHHSTVSFLAWGRQAFSSSELRGTLASTSISFDLSVFEIFLPLTSGHTVILARDILQFPSLSAVGQVTLLTTVPSAAAALLDTGGLPPTLKTINLAGESLSGTLVDRLYAESRVMSVNDLYGPTETTTYSTWARRHRGEPATIGRPIANTRVYLLDEHLQLAPIGTTAELFIAGEGVARGYLHQPAFTAERFVSLAHLGESGRAYRTGDLCQYRSDGSLVFRGRRDHQVKVNGFRIELGEIEEVLCRHPAVAQAVVVVREEGEGTVLCAAIQLAAGERPDALDLVRHQASLLPSHMVARRITTLDSLPHTASGKLDRQQVSALLASARAEDRKAAQARDPLEQELLAIWQEGFLDPGIGIDDDFFELGGHSLLALRFFSEVEQRLGQRMMLSVLFQASTVRRLADVMRRERALA